MTRLATFAYALSALLAFPAAAHAQGLPTAEALVCGWSAPRCQALTTITVQQVASVPGVAGARASYDPAARRIYVAPNADDAMTAAALAHELTHVLQLDAGQRYTPATCYAMEDEAFTAQAGMWAAAHGGDPAFTSPPGWAAVNATDDCQKRFG